MVHVCATLAGAAIIAQPNFAQETVGLMAYVKMMQDVSVKMALAARDVKWLQAALMGVATMAFAFLSQVSIRAANVNARRALQAWHAKWKYVQARNQARCAVAMASAISTMASVLVIKHTQVKDAISTTAF